MLAIKFQCFVCVLNFFIIPGEGASLWKIDNKVLMNFRRCECKVRIIGTKRAFKICTIIMQVNQNQTEDSPFFLLVYLSMGQNLIILKRVANIKKIVLLPCLARTLTQFLFSVLNPTSFYVQNLLFQSKIYPWNINLNPWQTLYTVTLIRSL